jgi:hypothetical protein
MKLHLTFATENLLPGINADIFFSFYKTLLLNKSVFQTHHVARQLI